MFASLKSDQCTPLRVSARCPASFIFKNYKVFSGFTKDSDVLQLGYSMVQLRTIFFLATDESASSQKIRIRLSCSSSLFPSLHSSLPPPPLFAAVDIPRVAVALPMHVSKCDRRLVMDLDSASTPPPPIYSRKSSLSLIDKSLASVRNEAGRVEKVHRRTYYEDIR
ncbi:hypothetical protein EW145_g7737 [Phellinidium pouzarii]|uniref:Uncharacterized protein n=1 Tax=Phellinidium pouzarii TaxID=167371 RepID=A0A4S4KEV0_9AGAM|nr:hypothetical protein EW145_g7737 [Phellinidium pouzarii]